MRSLSKNIENIMERAWDKRGSFKKDKNYKEIVVNNQNEVAGILGTKKKLREFNSQAIEMEK